MPQLDWNPLEFLECLNVTPNFDEEYETFYQYILVQGDLRLVMTVFQYEQVVELFLEGVATGATVFRCALFVRGAVKFINDKRGKYLEFQNCAIGANRFWYQTAPNVLDTEIFPYGQTLQLEMEPEMRIVFESNRYRYD